MRGWAGGWVSAARAGDAERSSDRAYEDWGSCENCRAHAKSAKVAKGLADGGPLAWRAGRGGAIGLGGARRWSAAAVLLLIAAGEARAQGASGVAPLAADLERFYSSPSLIGTAPRGVTWSPDGRRFAFLWNTDGTNFLDVFVATPAASGAVTPVRTTAMPRPAPAPASAAPDGTPIGYTRWRSQRAELAAELDGGVAAVAWHPDGRRLLVTFRGDLWLADVPAVAGGTPGAVRQLTTTRGAELRAAFAAATGAATGTGGASASVAYLRDGELFVASLRADSLADERQLTRLSREGVGVEAFAWSPDGAQLMLVETDRTEIRTRLIPDYLTDETSVREVRRAMPGEPSEIRRVGIVSAAGGEVRWLDLGGERYDVLHGWQWSPDGSRLVLDVSDVFVKHRRIHVVEVPRVGAPVVRTLVAERDSANVQAEWQVAWAPDGRGIYFTSDRQYDYHVWYAPLDGAAPRAVTSGAWAVFGFTVTPSGLFVTSNAGRAEERHLWRVPLGGGAPRRVTAHAGTHTVTVSPDGRWGADLFSSDTIPPDLHLLDTRAADDAGRRVTTSPLPDFAHYRFTAAQYVTFPSRADGATLHARLLLPPGRAPGERVPLIIGSAYSNTARNQWGGRNAHPLWGLDQVLLEKGFAILAVDVAGSSGHGTAFRRRIRLDYGGIDVEDLHSGVEWAIKEGIADSSRVGIWGSSYGGLLTTMSLFTKPHVYKAGVAGAPATNVWHALTGEQRVMMRPQEQMAAYANASSHTKAAGLQGKLMLIHGMRDAVVLYRDSAWLTQYLLQLGKDVELVTLPDAGHGWDLEGLAQTRYAFRKLVGFFERWLGTLTPR